MGLSRFFAIGLLAIAGTGAALIAAVAALELWAASEQPAAATDYAIMIAAVAILILLAILGVAWVLFQRHAARPMAALVGDARTFVDSRAEGAIQMPPDHWLGDLPDAVSDLAREVLLARREVLRALAAAGEEAEADKRRLEAILLELTEGVCVCTPDHRVILYNRSAIEILDAPEALGLHRPLLEVVSPEPLKRAFEDLATRLERAEDPADQALQATFACTTREGRVRLQARMSLILDDRGALAGYVVTFADVGAQAKELARRDALLRDAADSLRRPVANLRAAAEIIARWPDMSADERAAFDTVIVDESQRLSLTVDDLGRQSENLIAADWPTADIQSTELLEIVAKRIATSDDLDVTIREAPLWLHGDGHLLGLVIAQLIRRIHEATGARAFELEPMLGDRRVYLDIRWQGDDIPARLLDSWLEEPLDGAAEALTPDRVLERHASEAWSFGDQPGAARLRMPLPMPEHPIPGRKTRPPPRPDFYDFDLAAQAADTGARGKTALSALAYVVFDTETTGLRPSQGDEIVSIGAVRVVNARVLSGEVFHHLIHPGRPIPPASIKFHGITDEMVADQPTADVVLRRFASFAGDAVLVAHNAAFDMKFLRMKEREAGVRFENPVLDTLLLSVYLGGHTTLHGLDDIAERLGVDITDRHTALGDALATAQILVHMIELLERRGVATLDDALAAANSMVEVRKLQESF